MLSMIISILIFCLVIKLHSTSTANKNFKFIEKNYNKLIIILFLLCIITSVYRLGIVPKGMNVDEAGMYVDAKFIAKFGYDRYQIKNPVYFINYGGGQSAMYTYLTSLLIKIFGNKMILIRVPCVLLRIIAFISVIYLMKKEKSKSEKLLFLFLLTISPYFIMQSRWGLDCNLLVSFMTISVSILYNAINNKNNKLFLLSGILFGLSLYTYALSYIIIPIFIITLFLYLIYIKKLNLKNILIFMIPLIILATPLIIFQLVNMRVINEIYSFITINKIPCYRNGEISIKNILHNLGIFFTLLSYDRSVTGEILIYNSITYFGTIYYISVPFIIAGIMEQIKNTKQTIINKKINLDIIMIIWFIATIICSLIISSPTINKANAIFVPMIYFTMKGIININSLKPGSIKIFIPIYILYFFIFSYFYYFEYNNKYITPSHFATYYIDSLKYVKKSRQKNIYIDPKVASAPEIYLYVLYDIEEYKLNEIDYDGKKYIFKNPKKLDKKSYYITKNNHVDATICKKIKDINIYCSK